MVRRRPVAQRCGNECGADPRAAARQRVRRSVNATDRSPDRGAEVRRNLGRDARGSRGRLSSHPRRARSRASQRLRSCRRWADLPMPMRPTRCSDSSRGAPAARTPICCLPPASSFRRRVFADELSAEGIEAIALSGAQAGIVTDASSRRRDDSARRTARNSRAARAQRRSGRRRLPRCRPKTAVLPRSGRGGTDLSAIAIGHALDAQRVDIYTDVSGAMTADPRRVPGARTIERASLAEMTELANHGAKVMHHKAAEYANRTGTQLFGEGLAHRPRDARRRARR